MNINLFDVTDPISKLLGEWSAKLDIWSIVLRISISIIFAAIIGWERSTKRHAAGLRTFMLVSLSATVAMMLDIFLIQKFAVSMPLISTAFVIGIAIISSNSILYSSKSQIKEIGRASCRERV